MSVIKFTNFLDAYLVKHQFSDWRHLMASASIFGFADEGIIHYVMGPGSLKELRTSTLIQSSSFQPMLLGELELQNALNR